MDDNDLGCASPCVSVHSLQLKRSLSRFCNRRHSQCLRAIWRASDLDRPQRVYGHFDLPNQHLRRVYYQIRNSGLANDNCDSLERVHMALLPFRADQWTTFRELPAASVSRLHCTAYRSPPLQ